MINFTPASIKSPDTLGTSAWKYAEEYIKPLSSSEKSIEILFNDSTIQSLESEKSRTISIVKFTPAKQQTGWSNVATAFKVASYILILPVLIASGICIYFRSEYGIESTATSEDSTNVTEPPVKSSTTVETDNTKKAKTSTAKQKPKKSTSKKSSFDVKKDLLTKDGWMDGRSLKEYLERFSYKAYLSQKLPYTIVKALGVGDFEAILSKRLANAQGAPSSMKTSPPKEGRLACSFNIHGNHYTGLFVDFEKKTIFYYDPFGHKNTCPVEMKRISSTLFGSEDNVKIQRFDGKNHQRFRPDTTHALDHNNCGRYTLKFLQSMISAKDPETAYQNYISEDIDSDKIYTYAKGLEKSYPLSKKVTPADTPGDIPSTDPVRTCDLTDDEQDPVWTETPPESEAGSVLDLASDDKSGTTDPVVIIVE